MNFVEPVSTSTWGGSESVERESSQSQASTGVDGKGGAKTHVILKSVPDYKEEQYTDDG